MEVFSAKSHISTKHSRYTVSILLSVHSVYNFQLKHTCYVAIVHSLYLSSHLFSLSCLWSPDAIYILVRYLPSLHLHLPSPLLYALFRLCSFPPSSIILLVFTSIGILLSLSSLSPIRLLSTSPLLSFSYPDATSAR